MRVLGVCLPDDPEGNAKLMFSILDCLPRTNRATLIFLLDHLAMVVSVSERNKMSPENLATALAPPLMLHSANEGHANTDLDYAQPIGVLKYLLQIWPAPKHSGNVFSMRLLLISNCIFQQLCFILSNLIFQTPSKKMH